MPRTQPAARARKTQCHDVRVAVIVTALIAVLRWGMLAGLAGALGGLAGRGLARQYKGAAPGPLPTPWALRSALLGAVATVC